MSKSNALKQYSGFFQKIMKRILRIAIVFLFFIPGLANASVDSLLLSLEQFAREIDTEYSKIGVIMDVEDSTFIPSFSVIKQIDSLLSQTGKNVLSLSNTAEYISKIKSEPFGIKNSITLTRVGKTYGINAFLVISVDNFSLNHFSFRLFDVEIKKFIADEKTYTVQPERTKHYTEYFSDDLNKRIYVTIYGGGYWFVFVWNFNFGCEGIYLPSGDIGFSINFQRGIFGKEKLPFIDPMIQKKEIWNYDKVSLRFYLSMVSDQSNTPSRDLIGLGIYRLEYKYYEEEILKADKQYFSLEFAMSSIYWKEGVKFLINFNVCGKFSSFNAGIVF